jgi:hypothetical protein
VRGRFTLDGTMLTTDRRATSRLARAVRGKCAAALVTVPESSYRAVPRRHAAEYA